MFKQLEIESKKVLMENLHGKVTKLQEVTKNQQVDIELQVKAVQGATTLKEEVELISKARNISGTLKEPKREFFNITEC